MQRASIRVERHRRQGRLPYVSCSYVRLKVYHSNGGVSIIDVCPSCSTLHCKGSQMRITRANQDLPPSKYTGRPRSKRKVFR